MHREAISQNRKTAVLVCVANLLPLARCNMAEWADNSQERYWRAPVTLHHHVAAVVKHSQTLGLRVWRQRDRLYLQQLNQ